VRGWQNLFKIIIDPEATKWMQGRTGLVSV
jgi:hypothetical protein